MLGVRACVRILPRMDKIVPNKNRQYFKEHVEEYADSSYWRSDEDALTKRYFRDTERRLLVLGCGAGRVLPPLRKRGFEIDAIDIEPDMIEAAKKRCPDPAIHFSVQDAAHLNFRDKTFAYVFFPFHGIDYVLPDIYAAVSEAARVLSDDGIFIFNSHNRLYLKKLHRFFAGRFDDYEGLRTYRTSPMDIFHLKFYFERVHAEQRISFVSRERANFKDRCYQLMPWLNKSTYFICEKPKRV